MYFNAETQARILRPLPLRARRRRRPVPRQVGDAHHARRPLPARRPQAPRLPEGRAADDPARAPAAGGAPGRAPRRPRMPAKPCATRPSTPPRCAQVVVDADGLVVMVNEQARGLLRPRPRPTSGGRSRTSSSPTARSSCARASSVAFAERRAVVMPARRSRSPAATTATLDVQVTPLAPAAARARRDRHLPRRHRRPGACRTSSTAPGATSRPPTRSCSRRSRSSRRRTRSSSRPTRSSRRRTRSSSRPTRSSRR